METFARPSAGCHRRFHFGSVLTAAILAALAITAPEARAQSTWQVTSGTWVEAGSWNGGVPATTGTASFTGLTDATALLSTGTTIGGLYFNNSGSTTIRSNATTARTGTIGAGGVTLASTSGPVSIGASGSAANVVLNANQDWTNNSSASPLNVLGTLNNGGFSLTLKGTGTTNFSSAMSGAGGLTVAGGYVTSAVANTFSGGFTLSSGTFVLGNASAFGSTTPTVQLNGGALDANGTIVTGGSYKFLLGGDIVFLGNLGSLQLGGNATRGSGTLTGSRSVDVKASTLTLSLDMSESGGSYGITKIGAGKLTLGGSNSFTGGVTLSVGTLSLGNSRALGTGTFTISGSGARLEAASAISNNNPQRWNGDFTFAGTSNMGTGTVTLGATRTVTVESGELTLGGQIVDGNNGYGLTKDGPGQLTLTATSQSLSGPVTINAGTLALESTSVVSWPNASFTVNAPATLSHSTTSKSTTLGSIAGSGTVRSFNSGVPLTFGGNNASTTFSGVFAFDTTGNTLVKTGTGTFTYSGSDSISVPGTVANGVFLVTTPQASGTNSFTINAAGVLATGYALDQQVVNRIATSSAGVVALGANSDQAISFASPNLTSLSLGALNGTRAYTGTLTANGTTYRLGGGGGTLDFQSQLTGANSLVVGGNTAGRGGTVILSNTANNFSGATSVNIGTLEVASVTNGGVTGVLGTGTTINLGSGTSIGTLRYAGSGTSSSNRLVSISGSAGGGGIIEAAGNGPLILTGSVSVADGNKTLTLTGSSTAANSIGLIANPTTGSLAVVKDGPGLWRLTGMNTFNGGFTVKNGTVLAAQDAGATTTLDGVFGRNTPYVGAAGGTGTAALLAESGATIYGVTVPASATNQAVLIGGASGSGTANYQSGGNLAFGRNVAIVAAGGGVVAFASPWMAESGSGIPSANVAIGADGYTGTVRLLTSGTLATAGSVAVQYGTAVLGPTTTLDGAGTLVIDSPATLGGIGTVAGPLGGAGLVAPGNSPGILTAEALDASGGLDLAFEFTNTSPTYNLANASVNDVLRLTGTSPFVSGSLSAANVVSLYLPASAATGGSFTGGFFTDMTSGSFTNFLSTVSSGSFVGYYENTGGGIFYGDKEYSPLSSVGRQVTVSTTTVIGTTNFQTGGSVVDGQVTTFTVVVPEPAAVALAGLGIAAAAWTLRRRRRL